MTIRVARLKLPVEFENKCVNKKNGDFEISVYGNKSIENDVTTN